MAVDPAAPSVAVLLPCFNEAASIAAVVAGFRRALPTARIYVFDNNSTDATAAAALTAGALVRRARLQGKGEVIRQMFADVDADVYVMADGDGTYEPADAPEMVRRLLDEGLDMVGGARMAHQTQAYRAGHAVGNRILTGIVREIFGRAFRDMLTGYRVFSRRFVKSFPANAAGFETETELTIHALQMRLPVAEVETPYYARMADTQSKLRTVSDGIRILRMIGLLVREERPLQFFGWVAALALCLAVVLSLPVVHQYLQTGLVPRFPTLIVSAGLATVSVMSLTCGLILDSVARGRLELRRMAYLACPPPQADARMNADVRVSSATLP